MSNARKGATKAPIVPAVNDLGIEHHLLSLARQHANDTRPRKRGGPWSWTDARARAPWSRDLPPAWEDAFRDAYAERLVDLKLALPVGRSRTSGTNLSEETRQERGQGRISLRLSRQTLAMLEELSGGKPGKWIEAIVAAEHAKLRR